jgi:hypothetical protein
VSETSCAHSWRDFGQLGGRNVVWCSKCDLLAWTGKEPDTTRPAAGAAEAANLHAAIMSQLAVPPDQSDALGRLHDLIHGPEAPFVPDLPQTSLAARWYVRLCDAIEEECARLTASAEAGAAIQKPADATKDQCPGCEWPNARGMQKCPWGQGAECPRNEPAPEGGEGAALLPADERVKFEKWLTVRESGKGYPADLWEAWQARAALSSSDARTPDAPTARRLDQGDLIEAAYNVSVAKYDVGTLDWADAMVAYLYPAAIDSAHAKKEPK